MRLTLVALALAPVLAMAGSIKRPVFADLEKKTDNRMERAIPEEPFLLLGNTRGIYLKSFGAVFTTEISLLNTSTTSPFQLVMPKQAVVRIHAKKVERLPALKRYMRDALISLAVTLDDVPANEQVVYGVSLFYYHWEDTSGLPAQVLMQAERRKLIDLQAGRANDSVIQVAEF